MPRQAAELLHPHTVRDAWHASRRCSSHMILFTSVDTSGQAPRLGPPPAELAPRCAIYFVGEMVEVQAGSNWTDGWQYVRHLRRPDTATLSARRFAKLPKLLAHHLFPGRLTVFQDTKLRLRADAPTKLLQLLGEQDFLAFAHPCVANYSSVRGFLWRGRMPYAWRQLCQSARCGGEGGRCSAFEWMRKEAGAVRAFRGAESARGLQRQVARYVHDASTPPAAYGDRYIDGALIVQRGAARVMDPWAAEFVNASSDRDQLAFAFAIARARERVNLLSCGVTSGGDVLCPWGFPYAVATEVSARYE